MLRFTIGQPLTFVIVSFATLNTLRLKTDWGRENGRLYIRDVTE